MKKLVLFLLLEPFADWEASYLASSLQTLGAGYFTIQTVSLSKSPIHSMGGFTILPDTDLLSAPSEFDGLILIGGTTWRTAAAQQVEPLVRAAVQQHAVLGGICDAAAFLGTLGVLNHVRHTANDLQDLKQWAGSVYTGEAHYCMRQAVRDRRMITANGTAALEFAREVLLALEAAPESQILAWYRFHKYGCYQAPVPEL